MSEYSNQNMIHCKYRMRQNLFCMVCSEPAYGMNFNALTCQSCKAFFRRNALKQPELLRCIKNRSCVIDLSSRRGCPSCRLEKCLSVGMNRQLIQTAEIKSRKKQKLKANPYPFLITDENRLLLNQIHHAYKIRTEYIHPFDIIPGLILQVSTFDDLINARSIPILRLILFFKLSSSQFQILNTNDKVTLVKFNIPTLFWLNLALFYNPISNTFCEDEQYDLILDGKTLLDFYGFDIYNRIIKYLCLLNEFIQIDSIIIYLLILILLFSHFSNCISLVEPMLHDADHVRQTQNFYITLLVQFLNEKVGKQRTDFLLGKLILICLNIQNLSREIGSFESTRISEENLSDLMKVFLIR